MVPICAGSFLCSQKYHQVEDQQGDPILYLQDKGLVSNLKQRRD